MSIKGKERASVEEEDEEEGVEIEEGEAQPEREDGDDDVSLDKKTKAEENDHGEEAEGEPHPTPRRTVDYFGPVTRWKLLRTLASCPGAVPALRPQPNYVIDLLPPRAYESNTSTSYCTKYVHTSTNKIRTPVNWVRWTPDGRRVLTGSASGEFTLWNGLTFNFETILQAHDCAVRAFEWSHAGSWLVSCDTSGVIKYFQPNMNNVTLFEGHKEPVRDVSWAPDDLRFVTGSDDGTVKIWDFERREIEKALSGHGYDVRCVKWHPTKSLLVSGSKNALIKFWDPRTGTDLRTLHDHKNSIQAMAWSPNGNMVASASRDQSIKIFDIRMMKMIQNFTGQEACSVAWHPVHHDHLVSGGSDGSLQYWNLDTPNPVDTVEFAHEGQVWSMDFHPVGHLLATGSSDHTTRWWSRGRPGINIANDRFHIGREKAKELGTREEEEEDDEFAGALPGLHRGPPQQYNQPQNFYGGGPGASPGASCWTIGQIIIRIIKRRTPWWISARRAGRIF
ncbi:WD40 repeat-like protein [Cystobasidium minutum MCA 4210]|uniref:WD40 repeat-like protein n=1 Tax=Cystobasidium minutum MCA 4210 TaxID=1397322 RepID=UPI0034CF9C7D|eukprot:jgi/Rhomi1/183511/fgenesh1_pm.3_\